MEIPGLTDVNEKLGLWRPRESALGRQSGAVPRPLPAAGRHVRVLSADPSPTDVIQYVRGITASARARR